MIQERIKKLLNSKNTEDVYLAMHLLGNFSRHEREKIIIEELKHEYYGPTLPHIHNIWAKFIYKDNSSIYIQNITILFTEETGLEKNYKQVEV